MDAIDVTGGDKFNMTNEISCYNYFKIRWCLYHFIYLKIFN